GMWGGRRRGAAEGGEGVVEPPSRDGERHACCAQPVPVAHRVVEPPSRDGERRRLLAQRPIELAKERKDLLHRESRSPQPERVHLAASHGEAVTGIGSRDQSEPNKALEAEAVRGAARLDEHRVEGVLGHGGELATSSGWETKPCGADEMPQRSRVARARPQWREQLVRLSIVSAQLVDSARAGPNRPAENEEREARLHPCAGI